MKNCTKEEYENKINNSTLFEIDKERDFALYKAEKTSFIELLYKYYLEFISSKIASEFGYEFFQTAIDCIKCYKKENGDFLNYFNKSFSKKYKFSIQQEDNKIKRGALTVNKEDESLIKKIKRYFSMNGKESPDEEDILKIATALNINCKKVKELLKMDIEAVALSNIYSDGEDEIDLFDTIKSKTCENEAEQKLIVQDKLKEIESVFNSLQKREQTNKIISIMLTRDVIDTCADVVNFEELNYSFIDELTLKELLNKRVILSNKDIAEKVGVSEQSLSRTYNKFKERLKSTM